MVKVGYHHGGKLIRYFYGVSVLSTASVIGHLGGGYSIAEVLTKAELLLMQANDYCSYEQQTDFSTFRIRLDVVPGLKAELSLAEATM